MGMNPSGECGVVWGLPVGEGAQSKDRDFLVLQETGIQLVVFKLYHQGLEWSLQIVGVHKYLWNK